MKFRRWIVVIMSAVLTLLAAPMADADSSGKRLERLAIAQSQQLFEYYQGEPQPASPMFCWQAQSKDGVLLLPAASFWGGDRDFRCKVSTRSVLVDLGGYIPTEDKRYETSTYELANHEIVTFARKNLTRICDDLLPKLTPAIATLDGVAISGTPISTRTFSSKINRSANDELLPFYQDSIDVGHPGRLTSCFTGFKAIVPVTAGHHILQVDLTELFGGTSTVMTYYLFVTRH